MIGALLVTLLPRAAQGQCPFLGRTAKTHPQPLPLPKNHPPIVRGKKEKKQQDETDAYAAALAALDLSAVKEQVLGLDAAAIEQLRRDGVI